MSSLKIVVTGPVGAGKTTFITTLADEGLVSTEEQTTDAAAGKAATTVGLDYGRVQVHGHDIALFGTPGQERFDYLWDILAEGADGGVYLIPADSPSLDGASHAFVRRLAQDDALPVAVGITRSDRYPGSGLPFARERLEGLAATGEPIDARQHDQCRGLLAGLVEKIAP
jgi:hypothetical protein